MTKKEEKNRLKKLMTAWKKELARKQEDIHNDLESRTVPIDEHYYITVKTAELQMVMDACKKCL